MFEVIMPLSNNGCLDQMVPESCVPTSQTTDSFLPDFDLLLKDVNEIVGADTTPTAPLQQQQQQQLLDEPLKTPTLKLGFESSSTEEFMDGKGSTAAVLLEDAVAWSAKSWDQLDNLNYTELSLYEDQSPMLAGAKMNDVIVKQEFPVEPVASDPSAMTVVTYPDPHSAAMAGDEEWDSKIATTCKHLNIPNNPFQWTVEHVQRWLQWTLSTYNFSDSIRDSFIMDGGTFCRLSQEELEQYCPLAGSYLFTELDFWKTAYQVQMYNNNHASSTPSSGTPATTPESDREYQSFIDMDTFSQYSAQISEQQQAQQQQQHQQQQQMSIPTPVITSLYGTTALPPQDIQMTVYAQDMGAYCSPMVSGNMAPESSVSPTPSLDSQANSTTGSWSSATCSPNSLHEMEESNTVHVALHEVSPSSTLHAPRATGTSSRRMPGHGKHTIHLWQFLKELLLQPHLYQDAIRWLDRSKGIFKIEDSVRVAKLWGQRKNRPAMNYDKLSRSIRQYYKKGIIKKTTNSKRLVYQFCPAYM